jgi:hypothetical protein
MRTSTLLACAALALLLSGCPDDSTGDPQGDSQTHWLFACGADSECEAGLSCLCGVCTAPCEGDDVCAELGPGGVCASGAQTETACGTTTAPPICVLPCAADAECAAQGEGLGCEAGLCRPQAAEPDAVTEDTESDAESDATDGDTGEADGTDADAADPDTVDTVDTVDPDTDTTEPTDEAACLATGGTWHPDACGHYQCGLPNVCAAVIPGCDCGPLANFAAGQGCQTDPSCASDDETLCTSTGGTWHPEACGNYTCGLPQDCAAVIPGCDCGALANFEAGAGCAADPSCAEAAECAGLDYCACLGAAACVPVADPATAGGECLCPSTCGPQFESLECDCSGSELLGCSEPGTVSCGSTPNLCYPSLQFCETVYPGVEPPEPTDFSSCAAIPEACLDTPTCECIKAALGWGPEADCTVTDGLVFLTIALP